MNRKNIGILIGIVILIIILIVVFINISSNNTTTSNNSTKITIDDVISKFQEQGIEVILESKPFYTMVGAKDGEMFRIDNSIVKLYEYESEKDYREALEDYSILEKMPHKGLVVIDTNSEKALEIFNSL